MNFMWVIVTLAPRQCKDWPPLKKCNSASYRTVSYISCRRVPNSSNHTVLSNIATVRTSSKTTSLSSLESTNTWEHRSLAGCCVSEICIFKQMNHQMQISSSSRVWIKSSCTTNKSYVMVFWQLWSHRHNSLVLATSYKCWCWKQILVYWIAQRI